MSKYASLQLNITDAAHLVAALITLGFTPRVCDKAEHLEGYQGDKRKETAEIIIPRAQVGGAANDIGFKQSVDGRYTAIISQFDSHRYGAPWLGQLKVEYGIASKTAEMQSRGFRYLGREIVQTKEGPRVQVQYER